MVFLRTFAELRKAAISFVMSVRPSVWNNSASTGQIFMKMVFRKSVQKRQVLLQSDKNKGYLTCGPTYASHVALHT